MMDKLKPYPEYKDSGLPWLGCIPQHWEVRRNGRLFMQRNSTGYGSLPILEVSLKTGVRVRNMDNLKRKQVISDRNKYKRAAKGDIAYNMMRMWQGAVGVTPVDGLVSPAYVVVRPRPEVEPRYFSYLFRTDIYKEEVDGFSRGIVKDRNRLYWEDFKRIPSCFPSLAEQKIIADYLDVNAVKVRRFIRNRRRLIEVLNEQKQAIINRAVTRGLDSEVPLKSSGIDWLGDIPVHWIVKRLRHLIAERLVNGLFKKKDQFGSGVRLVNVFDVYRDDFCIDPSTIDRVQVTESEKTTYEVKPGDIFFVRSSIKLEGTGRTAFVATCTEPIVFECHLVRARPLDTVINSRYLANYLNSVTVRNYLVSRANTVTISTIPQGVLKDIPVAFPPSKAQQNEILKAIDRQLHPIVEGIARAQREIELILEYRTRLISDVVTGKIDVRYLAPPLCNEDLEESAEVLEPLEDDIDDVEMDEEEEINESD